MQDLDRSIEHDVRRHDHVSAVAQKGEVQRGEYVIGRVGDLAEMPFDRLGSRPWIGEIADEHARRNFAAHRQRRHIVAIDEREPDRVRMREGRQRPGVDGPLRRQRVLLLQEPGDAGEAPVFGPRRRERQLAELGPASLA
jgi:hypothetical protein